MTEPFELTGAGYLKARQWLKENNLLEVLEKEPSLDGYTTVALANKLYADKVSDLALKDEAWSLTSLISTR